MRHFETGATRDTAEGKPDYEGFLSPLVLKRFGDYMQKHRVQADGQVRASDNWQNGIPRDEYLKSLLRHVFDLWLLHRGFAGVATQEVEEALCGILFNAQGYLYEELKGGTMDWTSSPPGAVGFRLDTSAPPPLPGISYV